MFNATQGRDKRDVRAVQKFIETAIVIDKAMVTVKNKYSLHLSNSNFLSNL